MYTGIVNSKSHDAPIIATGLPDLWLLTEEWLSPAAIKRIVERTCEKEGFSPIFGRDEVSVEPVFKSGAFNFEYIVEGIRIGEIDAVRVVIVGGGGRHSFVDCLAYVSRGEPKPMEVPCLAVEVTKTTDSDTRNAGPGQRAIKFLAILEFYPEVERLYLQEPSRAGKFHETDSEKMDKRLLSTVGVELDRTDQTGSSYQAFGSVKALISASDQIKAPTTATNVPMNISRNGSSAISITGKLLKSGKFGHDPNKGKLAVRAAAVRKLGHKGPIVVSNHGLSQAMVGKCKFVRFCILNDVTIDGLILPGLWPRRDYWKRIEAHEKVGTIFLHSILEMAGFRIVFHNHGGCAKSDVKASDGHFETVPKETLLPDLVVVDSMDQKVVLIEGEKETNAAAGRKQLEGFGDFENFLAKKLGYGEQPERVVVTCGPGSSPPPGVALHLNTNTGCVTVSSDAPTCFQRALELASTQ